MAKQKLKSRSGKRKPKSKFDSKDWYFDFETRTGKWSSTDTGIYIWGAKNGKENKTLHWDLTMESFFAFIYKNKIKEGYFHNLSFDGAFIFDWLLKNNIHFTDKEMIGKAHIDKWSWFCDDSRSIYQMTINYKGHVIKLFCTYKILVTSIGKLGESLKKPKGDIDYDAYTYFNCKSEVPQELLTYLEIDIDTMIDSIKEVQEHYKVKLTRGSMAKYDFDEYYKEHYGNKDFIKTFGGYYFEPDPNDPKNKRVKKVHNVLSKEDWLRCKRAYAGGFTQPSPIHNTIEQNNIKGCSYDIISSYPGVMLNEKIPYGELLKYKPEGDHVELVEVLIREGVKTDERMPGLIRNNSLRNSKENFLDRVKNRTFTFFREEWEFIKKWYAMDYKEIDSFYFKTKYIFKDWLEVVQDKKIMAKNDVERNFHKGIFNSLYGKMGENFAKSKCLILHDPDHLIKKNIRYGYNNEYFHYAKRYEVDHYKHVAMAGFITMKGRMNLYKFIEMNLDSFLYCDTDSVYLSTPINPKCLEFVHDSKFGMWAQESEFDRFKSLRAKSYMYNATLGKKLGIVKKIAGLGPKGKKQVGWHNFKQGSVLKKCKLAKKTINGGIILVDIDFTL